MLYCKKLAVLWLVLALLAPLDAKTRKGEKLFSQGHAALGDKPVALARLRIEWR